MFTRLTSILFFFPGLILGVSAGFLFVLLLSSLPLSVTNPVLSQVGIHKPRIIGFLPYWLAAKATNNYNSSTTTLTYFGLTIDSDGHIVKLTTPQQEDPGWYDLQTDSMQKRFQDAKNNHITLSLSIVQQDEATISALLSDPKTHAQNLLTDISPLMKKYGFSDVNIDIESFKAADKTTQLQFSAFLTDLKQGLQQQNLGTLTVDVSPISFIKPQALNPLQVGKIADFMLIMAYDYHTVISPNTGPVAPLEGAGDTTEYDVTTALSVAKKEINPEKIILGIPTYGYEWDSLSATPGAATIPNTGATASNRRISGIFTSTCETCTIQKDNVAAESDFIYQDKKTDLYFHQAFLLDSDDLAKRVGIAESNNFAGLALWALGYEGDTLLKPLTLYKQSFQIL